MNTQSSLIQDVALRDVFADLGAETADLARLADRLQAVALPLIRQAGLEADSVAIEEAQRLDLLVQRLFALAQRMETLSGAAGAERRIAAPIMLGEKFKPESPGNMELL